MRRKIVTMRVDVSFLPALAAAFLLTFARVGTMVMLLPGLGELNVPARVRLTIALVLTAILLPLHQKAYTVDLTRARPGAGDAVPGNRDRRGARPDRAAGDLGAAGRRLGGGPAAGPRLRHRGRSDAGPAGRARRQFPDRARRHADLRHRPASPGDRGAERQLHDVRPGEMPLVGDVGAARHPHRRRPRSASAFSFRRRSWCSACCSISGLACCRG